MQMINQDNAAEQAFAISLFIIDRETVSALVRDHPG